MADAFLGIGSNLGDRSWHIAEAVRRLDASPRLRVVAVSSLYASEPVGYTEQPEFLNAVVHVTADCPVREVLAHCLRIEAELGRVRRERWGPRTLDLDVLLYDDETIDTPDLKVPHPRMAERAFVVVPLAEIAPERQVGGETLATLAGRLGAQGVRRIGALDWRPDYRSATAFLAGLKKRGVRLGLERMRRFAVALGEPEKRVPCVHLAGTNGKGSVAAMLEAMLRAAGWRTGLYTSPHLVRLGERIQVDRKNLSERDLAAYTAEIRPLAVQAAVATDGAEDPPSYFEFMTGMAFLHFARSGCDVAVVETGVGGRLDATNIVTPELSVITSIGMDHAELLGGSLEQIATEKAGIIKANIPVVIGRLPRVAEEVVRSIARERGARMFSVSEEFGDDLPRYPETSLAGDYQRWNAGTAVLAARVLGPRWRLEESLVRRALQQVQWPGRWERRRVGGRVLVLDASHNEEGAAALEVNLARLVAETGRRPIVIAGALGAARAEPLLATIARHAAEIHLVAPAQPRACTPDELARHMPLSFRGPVQRTTVAELFPNADACTAGGPDDIVVVTGSIYLLGEVLVRLDPSLGPLEDRLQDF